MIEKLISVSKPRLTFTEVRVSFEKGKRKLELLKVQKAVTCQCGKIISPGTPHKTAQVVFIDTKDGKKTSTTQHLPLHLDCNWQPTKKA